MKDPYDTKTIDFIGYYEPTDADTLKWLQDYANTAQRFNCAGHEEQFVVTTCGGEEFMAATIKEAVKLALRKYPYKGYV